MKNLSVEKVKIFDFETGVFNKNGVIVIKNVFDADEIEELKNELCFILNRKEYQNTIIRYRSLPWRDDLPERIDPISPYSEKFKSIHDDERITARIKKFMRDDKAKYFKDKVIFKFPGQHGYEAHQDHLWWAKFGACSVTCMIALDDADENNGGLEFLLGSYQKLLATETAPRFLSEEDLSCFKHNTWYLPVLEAGDVVFFHGLTVHRSGVNSSDVSRRSYFISYCN